MRNGFFWCEWGNGLAGVFKRMLTGFPLLFSRRFSLACFFAAHPIFFAHLLWPRAWHSRLPLFLHCLSKRKLETRMGNLPGRKRTAWAVVKWTSLLQLLSVIIRKWSRARNPQSLKYSNWWPFILKSLLEKNGGEDFWTTATAAMAKQNFKSKLFNEGSAR